MRFGFEYVVDSHADSGSLATASGMRAVVQAADRLGFSTVAMPEHPAPSGKWMAGGGHETLDPLTALAFVAGVTERLHVMTHLLVVPYRNAFLSAKGLATLDRLSEGRLVVGVGTGYLRSEFRALGVDMEERNARFDDALEVWRGVWGSAPYNHEGHFFTGQDVVASPGPLTPGGPPIIVGGNSALSRRRAARLDGWSPMLLSETVAASTRTPPLTTVDQLAQGIAEVRQRAADEGNPRRVSFTATTTELEFPNTLLDGHASVEEHRDHVGRLAEAGVDQFLIRPSAAGAQAAVESLHRYAEAVELPSATTEGTIP